MFYTYVLLSLKDNKRYYGMTSNLKRRILEHNKGGVNSTRSRRPLKLIYYEKFDTQGSARDREMYFKTRTGRRFLDSVLLE